MAGPFSLGSGGVTAANGERIFARTQFPTNAETDFGILGMEGNLLADSRAAVFSSQGTRPLKRQNWTHRRRPKTIGTPTFPLAASNDRALIVPFQTAQLRSRRFLHPAWSDAFAPPAPATVPAAAWLVPARSIKRKSTKHRALKAPAAPLTPLAPSIATVVPLLKARRIEHLKRLRKPLPVDIYPPPTGPPVEYYPAWATKQRPRTFQDRRLQRIAHNVYPQTPAATASNDRALGAPFLTRRIRSRRLLRAPELSSVQAATPSVSQAPVSAWRLATAKISRRTVRRIAAAPQPSFPATPAAPAQPVEAVQIRCVKRRRSRTAIFLAPEGASPAGVSAPESAWKLLKAKRISFQRRAIVAAGQPSFPATPAVPAQPEAGWRLRKALHIGYVRRWLKPAPQPSFPSAPTPPVSAWLLRVAIPVHQRRELQPQSPQPSFPVTLFSNVAALVARAFRRRETRRHLRQALHSPSYPPPIVPFQEPSSWKLAEVFRRHGWRIRRDVLEINEYPVTPPAPPVVENPGGHYWPTKPPKKHRDYREAQDEERQRDKQELRELIERAAGLIEEAAETAPIAEVAEARRELVQLAAYVAPKSEAAPFDEAAWQARIDGLVASTVDELIVRVADVLTELIQEIAEDE